MKALLHRIAFGPTTSLRAAQSVLDYHRNRRSHILMETSDGREGFALFGGFRARHRFGRLYLPTPEGTRTRVAFHRPPTAEYCRRLVQRYGLVVFCGDSAPPDLASELLSIPVMVDMQMPTPDVLEGPGAHWTRSAKANIARVKRARFEFDVVSSNDWAAAFHGRMFRPSMHERHGAEAYVDGRRALVQLARIPGSELLRVFQAGRWVAGSLNQATAGGYRLVKAGWLNGDDKLLKSGVVSAVYWFNFRRAADTGHRHILFGGVFPTLEDGVLLYKGHWGARLSLDGRYFGEVRLLLEPSHPTCHRFLRTHSLLTTGTDRDFIAFSGRTPDAANVPPGVLSDIKRWYTWRDLPRDGPAAVPDEVPGPLRPWVTLHGVPAST